MAKPLNPTRIVPSDDLWISENSERFNPHEGETVTVLRGFSVGGLRALAILQRMPVELAAVKGEEGEGMKSVEIAERAFETVCEELGHRVIGWTWTDDLGRPLSQPDGTAVPIRVLRAEELMWLVAACQGETPSEKKDGLKS